jgi:hypothetical protein
MRNFLFWERVGSHMALTKSDDYNGCANISLKENNSDTDLVVWEGELHV